MKFSFKWRTDIHWAFGILFFPQAVLGQRTLIFEFYKAWFKITFSNVKISKMIYYQISLLILGLTIFFTSCASVRNPICIFNCGDKTYFNPVVK